MKNMNIRKNINTGKNISTRKAKPAVVVPVRKPRDAAEYRNKTKGGME